jgi:hypothetical protein
MSPKLVVSVLLSLVFVFDAIAGIELVSFRQDLSPHLATLKLKITSPDTNIETELDLRYEGECTTLLENGERKTILSNKNGSIVAFNFWGGAHINDSVAMALLPDRRLMYFFNLNHVVARQISKFRKGLEESAFRVTDVLDDGIRLEYSEHSAKGALFRVSAHVLPDGNLQIRAQDIKDFSR